MSQSVEEHLWQSAGVRSISELEHFPFQSHQSFVAAIVSGNASMAIEFGAARKYAHLTNPRTWYVLFIISCIPFLFVPVTIIVAIATAHWLVLLGIPAALSSIVLASPYNPFRPAVLLGSLAALGYCLFIATVFAPMAWLCFAFGLSVLTAYVYNRTAWKWVNEAVLVSAALTACIWKDGGLYINGKNSATV